MYHDIRWTVQRVQKELLIIENLVYVKRISIPPFRCRYLENSSESPWIGEELDDSAWITIMPNDYWGYPRTSSLRLISPFLQIWILINRLPFSYPLGFPEISPTLKHWFTSMGIHTQPATGIIRKSDYINPFVITKYVDQLKYSPRSGR